MSELTDLLLRAQRSDREAEKQITALKDQDFPAWLQQISVEIATEGRPVQARFLAALLLKNEITGRSDQTQRENHERWKRQTPEVRSNVKQALLATIRSPEDQIGHYATLPAAEIAAVELPYNEWPDFLPTLLENGTGTEFAEPVKVATLECIGYTAERISQLDGNVTDDVTNKMLTLIVDGIQPARSDKIRLAAATALRNALHFCRQNMENKSERDAIVTAMCEATKSNHAGVRMFAYECVGTLVVMYYEYLQDYMKAIYDLSTETMRSDPDEGVIKAAIDIWSSLSEIEQELIDEQAELEEQGLPSEKRCLYYVRAAVEHLVPILLTLLARQEDDEDYDEYTVSMAAQVCLALISATVEDVIVPVIMPFVNANIQSEDWHLRDAAIMAFVCLLDGPSSNSIGPYVAESIPVLLQLFQDPHVVVRDTAVHCVSRICLNHINCVPSSLINQLIQALMVMCGPQSPNRVASHACSAIYNLAVAVRELEPGIETNSLSQFMRPLLETVLLAADRHGPDSERLHAAALEAVSILVSSAAQDMIPLIATLLDPIIERLRKVSNARVSDQSENQRKMQVQGLLCGVIQSLYQRLDKGIVAPKADATMEELLRVLQVPQADNHEECFSAIAAVADRMEADFARYMGAFQPLLLQGLRDVGSYQVCKVAVTTTGDICRAIESQLTPYCDQIMTVLIESLKSPTIHISVKPPVLSCFGEIAMAIGGAYLAYLQYSCLLLMQASQTPIPEDADEDLIDYFNLLRESILEAYTGIVQGMSDGGALDKFRPYLDAPIQFLHVISADPNRDDSVLSKAIGLVGDLARAYGAELKPQLQQPAMQKLFQDGLESGDQSIIETAQWASSLVAGLN